MKKALWMPLAAALVVTLPMLGCASPRTQESPGQYVDSSAVTAKVKAALLSDDGLKSFRISVETFKDGVQLSGFVNTQQDKERAGQIAAGVPGVRSVQNNLVVK
jgi:osmotically-inducible protein OsmY